MKALLFANTDWYLYNFRLPLARALRAEGWDVVLVSPPGPYSHCLLEEGFRWISFPLSRRGMNPLRELETILKLKKLYRLERPDIFHHFTIKCILYGSLACVTLGKSSGVINAVTGLGYVFTGEGFLRTLMRQLVLFAYRMLLKRTWIIFQNPQDRDFFLSQKLVKPGQLALIPGSGVDLTHYCPQPEHVGIPVVAFVGRLLRDKGVVEFVEAARGLKQAGVQAGFVLVGDVDVDNPGSVTREMVGGWVREGVVEWWGWQSDMLDVYTRANVICLPSYREGMPRVLAEAAGCARALVASDVPGCREIVQDGVNGLLVPPRNSQELAGALQKLVEDADLRKEMGRNSRLKVEGDFSVEKVVADTLKIYEQVMR